MKSTCRDCIACVVVVFVVVAVIVATVAGVNVAGDDGGGSCGGDGGGGVRRRNDTISSHGAVYAEGSGEASTLATSVGRHAFRVCSLGLEKNDA